MIKSKLLKRLCFIMFISLMLAIFIFLSLNYMSKLKLSREYGIEEFQKMDFPIRAQDQKNIQGKKSTEIQEIVKTNSIYLENEELKKNLYRKSVENKYNKVLIRNLIICFFIFGLALIFLVKKKTKYLLYLQEEVRLMKEGVLNRPIEIYGDDELTTFARNIEDIRKSFEDSAKQSEEDREFAVNMLHDIRTPLSSLIGYLDILSSKKVEDASKQDRYLDKSLEKTNQLKDLIDNLFTYLLESEEDYIGDTDDKTTSRDGFRELILDGLLFLESNKIKVNLTSEEETDDPLNISRTDVQRLVDNVFSNALKYSYRPGYVLIHVGENKDHVTLRLRNKIKEDDGMVESHGMGLKICEDILLKNKGFLMIKSAGGCFEVELGFRKL